MINRRDALRYSVGAAVAGGVVGSGCTSNPPNLPAKNTVKTAFTRKYDLSHPFVCAGMAFVCDKPQLAVAVSGAGGVGCLASSLLSPSTLRKRIREIKSATPGPFHINQLTPFPHAEHMDVCIEEGVRAVSFHWGLPNSATIDRLQGAGVDVWIQVGSVDGAKKARDAGADCIVVQGSEAGGHNYGQLPLGPFLSAVRESLGEEALLLGAGGIADGRTAAAAFAVGADGIWVGTRMVATHEANAHPEYKQRLLVASGEQTLLTSVYGPENPAFNPIRAVRNATISEWNDKIDELPIDRSDMQPIGRTVFAGQEIDVKPFDSLIPVPETTGDIEQMPILAGQGVGLITEIHSASEIVSQTMDDAARRLVTLV